MTDCKASLMWAHATGSVRFCGAMSLRHHLHRLSIDDVELILTVTSKLALVAGYDFHGVSRPAELTGGDTFDLAVIGQDVLIVLGDATGHGIAPALSVTQMQAMLRMAFRLGADLETAFLATNNQLAETMADDRPRKKANQTGIGLNY